MQLSKTLFEIDRQYMDLAFSEAEKAFVLKEVPVGAVLVKGEDVIAVACNQREREQSVSGHAELTVIQKATEQVGDWRLTGTTLYSTLEPCPMCMGAILHARIERVVYGAHDLKWGACGTVVDLSQKDLFHHHCVVEYMPDNRCSDILKRFFKELRG
ncbi:tRNA-specific adenosine deaminase [Candidatus Marinamargulisbacteria bacterium SCGC AG-439-L15]|nr:tRNA-specific adenosine deaminase [Candidatus Marinamargulisbacteria bacterium SCGC AG-439-L15]